MTTILPTDENNMPIPALRLRDGGAHKITVTATSARNAIAFDAGTRIITLYTSVAMYVRQGGPGVVATTSDHYIPAGTSCDIAIGGEEAAFSSFIAALRVDTDGILYISERN